MKTFVKRLLLFAIVIFAALYITNSETDFFKNFDDKFPLIAEKYPAVSSAASDISELFSKLPTISQISAHITKDDMPLNPESFAENAYIKDSPLLSFYDDESIGIVVNEGKSITIFGVTSPALGTNLAVQLMTDDSEKLLETTFAADTGNEFSKTIELPETDSKKIKVDVYTGLKKYGKYTGWVNSYIYLVQSENGWKLYSSPAYENNKILYSQTRSISKALKPTNAINSDDPGIKSVAQQLTESCTTDYERISKIHDWICSYLHYDNDSLQSNNIAPYTAKEVIKTRKAVCLGFANLYAALLRSIDIPCYVVTGYALEISSGSKEWTEKIINGTEENHAWNEAYVDGRWVIVDTTWDSFNSYENGEMKKADSISHLYFDSNIDFFSTNHKIISYE